MPERTSTTVLTRVASALTRLAPVEGYEAALAIARELSPEQCTSDERDLLRNLLQLAAQRVRDDDELRRTRERLGLLSSASFEGLFFHVDGCVIDANQRLSELTGYDQDEILGTTLLPRCVAPEDLPSVLERMANRYEGTYVITGIRKDGSRFRAELQAKQGKLGDRPVRVAAVRDVTDRERIEALLRESETRLRQLAEAAFDIITFNRMGVIMEITGPVEEVLGYTREEMVGRKVTEFVTRPSAEHIEHVVARGITGAYEAQVIRKDGAQIPVEVVAVKATLNGEPVRMAALRDLREAKRLAEERRALELAFERSQRLDSLGVLAGGIAHDFNNLLTAVLGNAELLEHRLEEPALREMAQSIVDASQRAASLTAQMLAYAGRRELGPRSSIDLGTLISDLHSLLGATLSKKARVLLALEPDSRVLGNRATLTQVLMNLLTNASDALGDEPGTISVRTRRIAQPDPRWAASLGAKVGPGAWILLEIKDNGGGMDPAVQARIFEPFFTTKAKGHGLGLAACIGIISSHGGAILVESEKGHGSTFSVLLPADTAPTEPSHSARVSVPPAIKKVLVVDDEPLVRTHLKHAFQSQGYEVIEAEGGRAALALFAEEKPSLIVLDLTMPDLSGIEVLRAIRRDDPRVPVILASGYHDAVLDREAGGFQAFLAKPYTLAELLHAVERALNTA